jgi:hypothetical protein
MFEGKADRSTDESDLQLEIDSSLSEAILAEDWLKPEEEAAWQDL